VAPRLVWVDVFAARPLTGNPLAVVLDADAWDSDRMQALAAELGLSETVFVLPAEAPEHVARLRIFTPVRELPMAGHPVVGAAWVLAADGRLAGAGRVETGVGPLGVRVAGQVATMEQAPPQALDEVDPTAVSRACGVEPAPSPPTRVWSTGLPQLMMPVPDVEALAAARPDASALAALSREAGWIGVSLYALEASNGRRAEARVRHFAPAVGVLEDPVTGSAAGALGACLAAAGHGDGEALELVVRQGLELGRPGEVAVRVRAPEGVPERVQIGGRVVLVLEGRLRGL
jgi:trans-2,3-dihydro-3-hydroxyanthranilate isomerase